MTKDSEGNRTEHGEVDCKAVNTLYDESAGRHLTVI